MKKILFLFSILLLSSCGLKKNISSDAGSKVLYSEHHKELNGILEVKLMSGSEITCEANIIQLFCISIDNKELTLRATNGITTLKLLDEKSYYFTPNCNGKKVELIVFHSKDGTDKYLKTIRIKVP